MTQKIFYALTFLGIACADVEVCAQASNDIKFMRIADASLLQDGDEIILVSSSAGVAMSKYQSAKKDYILPCSVTINEEDNLQTVSFTNDSVAVFKLNKLSGGWRLGNDDVRWLSSKRSPKNALCYADSKNEKRNLIDIKFSSEGNAHITFKNVDNDENKCLDYRASSTRFSRYNGYESYNKVQVYRRLPNVSVVDELRFVEGEGSGTLATDYKDAFVRNVVIDRTFHADGGYYTICLPFSLTEDDIRTAFPGAQFKQLTQVEEVDDDHVAYHFLSVKTTNAGEPYLMRILPNVDKDIVKPVVHGKFILAPNPKTFTSALSSGDFKFVGTYDPVLLPADGRYRFICADGTQLVTPNKEGKLKGLRAYFVMPQLFENCDFDSNGKPRSVAVIVDIK